MQPSIQLTREISTYRMLIIYIQRNLFLSMFNEPRPNRAEQIKVVVDSFTCDDC